MPLDCLVINLTRFGDLIQSQPLFHDLKNHGFTTGLLCLENFVKTIPLLKNIEQSWTLKGAHLLALLNNNWPKAASELLGLAHEIQAQHPKYIINLTPTIAARLLARLFAANQAEIIGFGLDGDGFGLNKGAWSTFLSGTTSCRQNSVFNIVDMFRLIGRQIMPNDNYQEIRGLNLPAQQDLYTWQTFLNAQLAKLKLDAKPQGFIAMQLGASSENRMWPVEYFAKVADHLWTKNKYLAILTGTIGEKKLVEAYQTYAQKPFIDAIGATSLPVLAALLKSVALLISNDTGTMHLAAGLGTKSLGFFLATAQPWDTGPYLQDCLCLEPDLPCHPCQFKTQCPNDFKCRTIILPEYVAQLIDAYLNLGEWPTLPNDAGLRIWQTQIDPHGLAIVEPKSKHAMDDRTLFIRHQRNFWRQLLDSLEGMKKADQDPIPACTSAFCQKILPILTQVERILLLLIEQGQILGKNKDAGKLFLRNCDRIQTLLSTNQ
ncbi:MAG: glycosyltransferase family 9 protein, partial [Desulfovibrionaceae bacterium]|nr:glycosyltransferase family 9 protein [Desulfovibrionaceae bacterium]